jgi:hypothetical protein
MAKPAKFQPQACWVIFFCTNLNQSVLNLYLKDEKLCGSFKLAKKLGPQIANPKIAKDCISQIRKLSHLQKLRKFNTFIKSASLWICDLRNLFADRPILIFAYVFLGTWGYMSIGVKTFATVDKLNSMWDCWPVIGA